MDATVGHQHNLVINALSDGQPVQRVMKYRSNVLVESSASNEVPSGVRYGLQTLNRVRWSAVQDRVAVVHLAQGNQGYPMQMPYVSLVQHASPR